MRGFSNVIRLVSLFLAEILVGIAVRALTPAPFQSAPSARPTFEVASIRPSSPDARGFFVRPTPGNERYVAQNATLKLLLGIAYSVKDEQIKGGPAWIDSERWDMDAKASRPSTIEELHAMLQDLLMARFSLHLHSETKTLPVYALVADNSRPKLAMQDAKAGESPWIETSRDQRPGEPVGIRWHATASSMTYLARRLSDISDRPVIDETGLKGEYDFDLTYSRELPQGAPAGGMYIGKPNDLSDTTLFTSLRTQLGLRLEPRNGPVKILMIERAEKPADN